MPLKAPPASETVVQFWYNFPEIIKYPRNMWRRRVGVEPTIRSAKGRIGGFEGRDSHRTIFASAWIIDHYDWAPDELANLLLD